MLPKQKVETLLSIQEPEVYFRVPGKLKNAKSFSHYGMIFIFFFRQTDLAHSYLGKRFGQLILIFYFITLYAQLLKAVNRLIAIGSPINYRIIFNEHNAKYFVATVVFISLGHGIVYFFGKFGI